MVKKHAGVVNGLLRTIIRTLDNLVYSQGKLMRELSRYIQSHPNWMVNRWITRFGFDEAVKLCEENNKRPVMSLRVNNLKISVPDFENYLKEKPVLQKRKFS